jgi:hypothetical protein
MPTHHSYMETKQTSLNYQKSQTMSRKVKWVEVYISLTRQEPVEVVNAMDVVMMTVQAMIPSTFCLTLTILEASRHIQVTEYVLLMGRRYHL